MRAKILENPNIKAPYGEDENSPNLVMGVPIELETGDKGWLNLPLPPFTGDKKEYAGIGQLRDLLKAALPGQIIEVEQTSWTNPQTGATKLNYRVARPTKAPAQGVTGLQQQAAVPATEQLAQAFNATEVV